MWMDKLAMHLLRPGESPKDQPVRKRLGTMGSAVGVAVNLLLALGKGAAGLMTGSVAAMADAVNNLSDAASSVVALISMHLAQKPVDREHPFGHGRMEYLGALGVGLLILLMGMEMLFSSFRSILHPEALDLQLLPFLLLIASVAVKGALFLFYRGVGRLIDYPALLAAAKDSLSDMAATTAVALAMVAGEVWQIPADGVMGCVVALLVLKAGFGVVKEMVDTLMGGRRNPELGREIVRRLLDYEGILGVHDLIIHDYGPGRCVASVHAEVPSDGTLPEVHALIDRAEREVDGALGVSLCIHMDPVTSGDERTDTAQRHLSAALKKLGGGCVLHDLRIREDTGTVRLCFDVAIPPDMKNTEAVQACLMRAARELNEDYQCEVHYDVDYYRSLTS